MKLRDHAMGGDAPDVIAAGLGEPEGPIWSQRDTLWERAGGQQGKLGKDPSRGDTPDLVGVELGEPERAAN